MKLQIGCLIIIFYITGIYCAAKRNVTRSHIVFTRLLAVSALYLIADIITVYTVNHIETVPWLLNQAAHRAFLVLLVYALYLIFGYVYILVHETVLKQRKWQVILCLMLLLCTVLPLEFTETPAGNYAAGPAVNTLYFSTAFYNAGAVYMFLRYWREIQPRKRNIIFLAIISQIAVCLYQACRPLSLISGLGLTLVVLSFFLTSESPDMLLIERLREEKEKAYVANQAKTTFLARMSHEIRTPINAIVGMNEMILRESTEAPVKEYAWEVKAASGQLLSIVNDILDLSKIESGKMELVPAEYELSPLINDLYSMISAYAAQKKLELKVHANPELPSVLYGDDIRLKQIITNLLTNAVKYTAAGTVSLTIDGESEGDALMLHVKVEDTGIGIRREDMKKLFAEYERIEEAQNRSIEGTGLGMNITKQLLEMMGGRLEVKSEYGKGSVFEFRVKQRIIRKDPIGNLGQRMQQTVQEYSYASTFTAPEARILVVDDSAVNRMVFRNLLKNTEVRLEEASCGAECVEKTEAQHYDMIFLDHMMPDMDGIQTFARLKASKTGQCRLTPVIIFTANAVKGEKEKYLQMGFDGFLSKPINPAKLENLICHMLPQELVKQGEPEKKNEAEPESSGVLPELEGFCWEYARLYIKTDEMILESVKAFAASLRAEMKALEELAQGLADGKLPEQYRIKVHAIKSSSAMLGAAGLSELAKLLEYAARDGDMDRIRSLHPVFMEELEKYRETLSVLEDTKEKPMLRDRQKLLGWIEMVRGSMINVDIDAADKAMEQINSFRYEPPLEERLEKLSWAVMNMDEEACLFACSFLTEYLTKGEQQYEESAFDS